MPEDFDNFFIPADEAHIGREKTKARDMRKSQWWKNIKGRGTCHYCSAAVHPSELTMDHVVPIVRGGKTTRSNVVPCCKTCNSQKKYLLPIEWQDYLRKQAEESGKKR
jgi:5-methylcytosine-specific restriction protein A